MEWYLGIVSEKKRTGLHLALHDDASDVVMAFGFLDFHDCIVLVSSHENGVFNPQSV